MTATAADRLLTSSAAERARRVVDEVLERAARNGERATAWARASLSAFLILVWPFTTWTQLISGDFAIVSVEVIAVVGLVFSGWTLRRTRGAPMTRMHLLLSVLVDAALVLAFLAAFVARPPFDYVGVDRISGFGGDSIMAVFGAPQARPDDAIRAVKAAAAMDRALTELNVRREARGQVPLRHGIGVHHGVAVAGNIGTTDRVQYTVIGDTVNVAARLESATKEVGVSVLISAAARDAAARSGALPALQSKGSIQVKGRAEALEVFSLS